MIYKNYINVGLGGHGLSLYSEIWRLGREDDPLSLGDHYMYKILLVDLDFQEEDLNRGRFRSFSHYEQKNQIVGKLPREINPWFSERISWIADQVTSVWSINIAMNNVVDGQVVWSFDDLNDALMFKLTF